MDTCVKKKEDENNVKIVTRHVANCRFAHLYPKGERFCLFRARSHSPWGAGLFVSQPSEGLFVLRLDYDIPSQRSIDSQISWDFSMEIV